MNSPHRPRLLVASFNPGKAHELVRLVAPLGIDVVTLRDLGLREPYEEIGTTYEENARGKALHYAALARMTALADDSGLEVDALGGRPGPLSARYGGEGLDDPGRVALLLREMEPVPEAERTARYVTAVAIARPPEVRLFHGSCKGRIAREPRGERGFGYDPVFLYPPFGATFGEIDDARKDSVSHRGKALRQAAAFLSSPEGIRFVEAVPSL